MELRTPLTSDASNTSTHIQVASPHRHDVANYLQLLGSFQSITTVSGH
jgi:hypothetical protein